jgi:dipeptidyl-peptidase-4
VRARIAPTLAVACLALVAAGPGETKKLTLEQTSGPGRVSFTAPAPAWSFARDGVHLELKKDGKVVWIDPKTKAESEPAPEAAKPAAAKDSDVVAALAQLPGFDEGSARKVAATKRGSAADGSALLLEGDGELYFFRAGRDAALRLTSTPEPEENALLSPDARLASFVRGSDVFLVETDGGRERAITKDGGPERLNGKLDWVYQEEVYGRGNFQACWWSSTSRHLAFLSLDETGVPHVPIVDHSTAHCDVEDTRYPKAGDPNPKATLLIARARDGKVVRADLSKYAASEPLIVRVGWTPDGRKVCFQVQDREQTWLDLDLADPDTGKVETLFRETAPAAFPAWVNVLIEPRWLADGSFLWLSERSGFKHLYHYEASGKLKRQLTDGEWEVRDLQGVDEKRRLAWFTSSRDSAVGSNLDRVGLDGGAITRLTQGGGTHAVEWNADRSRFLDRVSSLAFPPEVRLCDGEDGKVLEVLGKADVKALAEYGYSTPQLLQIPARDGYLMDAMVLAPATIEPGKKHPLWLPTYSGPDAPSVADRWSGDPWLQFLAQQGVGVLQVNNRTSGQRGLLHIAKCYQRFGLQELADLEDALQWVAANLPWADTSRVGISGWSYGGFMTAFALTHSKAFKLGVAGAGVYDWRLYDSIYTERYMRTPANNPDGYAKTSCIEAAKDLSGYLVLAHGTIDDNVHFQNTVQFAAALQKADKEFDLMIYPRSRHGLSSSEQQWNFRKLTWKAIRERL